MSRIWTYTIVLTLFASAASFSFAQQTDSPPDRAPRAQPDQQTPQRRRANQQQRDQVAPLRNQETDRYDDNLWGDEPAYPDRRIDQPRQQRDDQQATQPPRRQAVQPNEDRSSEDRFEQLLRRRHQLLQQLHRIDQQLRQLDEFDSPYDVQPQFDQPNRPLPPRQFNDNMMPPQPFNQDPRMQQGRPDRLNQSFGQQPNQPLDQQRGEYRDVYPQQQRRQRNRPDFSQQQQIPMNRFEQVAPPQMQMNAPRFGPGNYNQLPMRDQQPMMPPMQRRPQQFDNDQLPFPPYGNPSQFRPDENRPMNGPRFNQPQPFDQSDAYPPLPLDQPFGPARGR